MNREVVIRPTDAKGAGGERLDIYVQAAPQKSPQYPQGTTGIEILSVPIGIKGCWNSEVPTSQTKQLAERYLKSGEREVGIYLIGMLSIERWNVEKDGRKSKAKQVSDKVKLQLDLDVEAENIAKALAGHIKRKVRSRTANANQCYSGSDRRRRDCFSSRHAWLSPACYAS